MHSRLFSHECVASWGSEYSSGMCRKQGTREIIFYKIGSIVSSQDILVFSKVYFDWDNAVRRQAFFIWLYIKLKIV